MSKVIEGIPESFTQEQYLGIFRACGVDPRHVKAMYLAPQGAHITVFALDTEGNRILDLSPGQTGYLKHDIFIPVEGR